MLPDERDRREEACADLEKAIQYDPDLPWVYAALGRAYNNMARWEDAQRALEVALRLDPKLWQAHYEAARADAGQHKHDAALRHIQAATAIGAADSDEIAALNALILAKAQESRLH